MSAPEYALIGRHVTVRGGFEDGLTGVVIANEPREGRPYRYRIALDAPAVPGATLGGLNPVNLDPSSCAYCGEGQCRGSAETAGGRDVTRFHEIHEAMRNHAAQLLAQYQRANEAQS